MNVDTIILNVANVVHSWMGYLYEVSEVKHLAAESSLKYPIVGLLERKVAITNVELEIEHPSFSQKRVDFYWEANSTKNYMEMKYIRDVTVDIQKILNDVFRLALLDQKGANKYFLVCSKLADFKRYFQNVSQESNKPIVDEISRKTKVVQCGGIKKKILDQYFSFDDRSNVKEVRINVANDKYYKKFQEDYDCCCNEGIIPNEITIKTELVQPIDKGLKSAVAVWAIERISDN